MDSAYQQPRRELYPMIEAARSDMLKVSQLHTIYVEQSGALDGRPALALHGGPGGGVSPEMRRFFDPARTRIVMMDQRGCGRSTPHAETRENTTWDLVADIERVREKLGIDKWLVFGGSWGSTLALAYAAKHPERVSGLVLRGIFLLTKAEIDWFYQNGASNIYPDAFARYVSVIPPEERGDLVAAFHKRLTRAKSRSAHASGAGLGALGGRDDLNRRRLGPARALQRGSLRRSLRPHREPLFRERRFFRARWLAARSSSAPAPHPLPHRPWPLRHVHAARFCLGAEAAWPEAELDIIPDAGHSSTEPGMVDALVRATDAML